MEWLVAFYENSLLWDLVKVEAHLAACCDHFSWTLFLNINCFQDFPCRIPLVHEQGGIGCSLQHCLLQSMMIRFFVVHVFVLHSKHVKRTWRISWSPSKEQLVQPCHRHHNCRFQPNSYYYGKSLSQSSRLSRLVWGLLCACICAFNISLAPS